MSVLLLVVVWVVSVGCRPGDTRSALSTSSVADLTRNTRQVRTNDKQITEGPTQCDVKQTSDNFIFNCLNATAFSSLPTQRTGNRSVVVHISRVEGQLDLCPLTNLTLIYLNITSANLTGFTQCNLNFNQLQRLYLTNNPNLNASLLYHLGPLPGLVELSLRGSALATITDSLPTLLQQMPNLIRMDVSSTELLDIDQSSFVYNQDNQDKDPKSARTLLAHLRYLNVANNSLTRLPFSPASNMSSNNATLKISDLSSIPVMAPAATQTLLLQHNHLSDLSGLTSAVWCNLITIKADYNRLETLVPQSDGACSCLSDDDVDVDNETRNTCFPQYLENLMLSHNNIKKLSESDCHLLYSVRRLDLSWNMLQSLGIELCGSLLQLRAFILNHNRIQSLTESDFVTYPSLQELSLAHNNLKTLPVFISRFMYKLRILDVSHNNLTDLTEVSAPKSPVSSRVGSLLEELRLNHNNFSEILPVFDLNHINTLKKLSLHDNPWSCDCKSLSTIQDRLISIIANDAFGHAVRTMQCRDRPGFHFYQLSIIKECPEEEEIGARTIWGYMGYFVITVTGIFICCNLWPRCARIHSRSSNRDMTQGRKFDVFVCHAFKDYELVKKMVIAPLISHGYSVAWHDNAFKPGEWVVESVERTVSSSRRMIVVASENLTDSRWATFEIRRGLHEENAVPGFKITALVMDTLPKLLRRDLYDLVALRTHIVQSNSDYLMKLREFLPDPRAQAVNESFSPDALKVYFQLLEQMKEKKKSERVPVTKLFSIRKESSHVSINIDIADPSEMTDEDYEITVQRFKQSLLLDHVKHPHTIHSNYMMANHGNDGEVIAQLEGFRLKSCARKSCRF